jgi:nucleotide-binding universal stress UspA family protein
MIQKESAERPHGEGAIMFKKLLLPLDLTDRHEAALEIAAEQARQSRGEVCLLHVIEIMPGLPVEEERDFYNRLEKAARTHLGHLGERLGSSGVAWRAEVRYGNRGGEILAASEGADLIVLTAPRLDLSKPAAGLGSLSYKVSILASCPVLLVK